MEALLTAIAVLLTSEKLAIIILNFGYAIGGGLFAIPLCMIAYYMFNKVTPQFIIGQELRDGNIAVGIAVGALLVGVCICTGLVFGLGLN